ncbi:MAG TPA: HAD-IIIA family hydrolase [Anaerolineales bacterium]|nr:HAD-IIIA family hydrolase [Anaerolineales bacterium]
MYREKLAEYGLAISDEKNREVAHWEHYYWARSPELMQDSAKFDVDSEAFWSHYSRTRLEKMGAMPEEIEEFRLKIDAYFANEYAPKNRVPPDIHRILPELRATGFILAVLSNRRTSFMDIIEELSLDGYFDAVMAAGEVGAWKPDPKVFTPLLERFNLSPKETVYIGDNYFSDVVGARNAGITPILYDPRGIFPDADVARITSFEALGELL